MLQVLLAIEIVLAIALVAVILLQKSEGGALGMGGGAGIGGLLSARGTASLLTRTTAFLAIAFIVVALLLANLAGKRGETVSVFDTAASNAPRETLPNSSSAADDGLPPLAVPAEQNPKQEGTSSSQ